MLSNWIPSGYRAAPEKTLLIVRHGETEWTRDRRMTSFTDVPLNAVGVQQAKSLANYLSGVAIESILTSPLARSAITSDLIAKAQPLLPTVHTCNCLSEVNFGKFEGWRDDSQDIEFKAWRRLQSPIAVTGIETATQAYARAEKVFRAEWKGVRLAVTHGCLGRILVAAGVLGMEPSSYRRLRLDPCGVAILTWHMEGPRLSAMNVKANQLYSAAVGEPVTATHAVTAASI